MRNIAAKEFKLSASQVTYFFILFGLMFFVPGYPVLCGAFFVTLGIFQSFQNAREANDILFSVLLPVARKDVVKGKYIFVCSIELCAFLLMAAAVCLRMTLFSYSPVYVNNALMNANLFALGMALFIFGLFNAIFAGGFFKTAYKLGRPFVIYSVAAFLAIGAGEALCHIPGLEVLNAFGTEHMTAQAALLGAGIVIFVVLTWISYKKSCNSFDKTDL